MSYKLELTECICNNTTTQCIIEKLFYKQKISFLNNYVTDNSFCYNELECLKKNTKQLLLYIREYIKTLELYNIDKRDISFFFYTKTHIYFKNHEIETKLLDKMKTNIIFVKCEIEENKIPIKIDFQFFGICTKQKIIEKGKKKIDTNWIVFNEINLTDIKFIFPPIISSSSKQHDNNINKENLSSLSSLYCNCSNCIYQTKNTYSYLLPFPNILSFDLLKEKIMLEITMDDIKDKTQIQELIYEYFYYLLDMLYLMNTFDINKLEYINNIYSRYYHIINQEMNDYWLSRLYFIQFFFCDNKQNRINLIKEIVKIETYSIYLQMLFTLKNRTQDEIVNYLKTQNTENTENISLINLTKEDIQDTQIIQDIHISPNEKITDNFVYLLVHFTKILSIINTNKYSINKGYCKISPQTYLIEIIPKLWGKELNKTIEYMIKHQTRDYKDKDIEIMYSFGKTLNSLFPISFFKLKILIQENKNIKISILAGTMKWKRSREEEEQGQTNGKTSPSQMIPKEQRTDLNDYIPNEEGIQDIEDLFTKKQIPLCMSRAYNILKDKKKLENEDRKQSIVHLLFANKDPKHIINYLHDKMKGEIEYSKKNRLQQIKAWASHYYVIHPEKVEKFNNCTYKFALKENAFSCPYQVIQNNTDLNKLIDSIDKEGLINNTLKELIHKERRDKNYQNACLIHFNANKINKVQNPFSFPMKSWKVFNDNIQIK